MEHFIQSATSAVFTWRKLVISAMALQAGMLEETPSWEKLEAWLRSSRGQLPMLVVFENAEDVLIHEDSAEARDKSSRS